MYAIVRSKSWPFRLLRIAMLASIGWWALQWSGWLVRDEIPWEREWPRTDFSRRLLDLNEIVSGGPPKDGIPAIDNPRFVSTAEAADWLDPREPVVAVERGRRVRAYPLQILVYHEIVNDELAGVPIAVTFCPLCNAALVFERRVGGHVLDFGTTGKLRKSDLVMYDRQTESWWQQFTGTAIVGHYAGTALAQIPARIVAYEQFRAAYPGGEVLSRVTGYLRRYGLNPYSGYDRIGEQPFLFLGTPDGRLPPMERVLGIVHDGRTRVYPFRAFSEKGVINDELGTLRLVVFYRHGTLSVLDARRVRDSRLVHSAAAFDRLLDGRILHFALLKDEVVDRETGSRWSTFAEAVAGPLAGKRLRPVDSGVHFAFAWLAFRPDSEIYRPSPEGSAAVSQ